jgi:hypothetical protein
MAKRRSRNDDRRQRSNRDSDRYDRRKSYAEARIERMTWFLLVLVFAILNLLDLEMRGLNWVLPLAGAVILLGSGMLQYMRGWMVSPVTWLGGAALVGLTLFNLYLDPTRDFLGIALIIFAVVILIGLLTGET